MSGTLKFDRTYLDFGTQVRPIEKTADVASVFEDILTTWGYDVGDQIGGMFSAQWLGEGERPTNDTDRLDLIFEITGEPYFEIALRGETGVASYGGWLFGKQPVVVTDEIVNGHRVLLTTLEDGAQLRHEFFADAAGYLPSDSVTEMPLRAVRRIGLRLAG